MNTIGQIIKSARVTKSYSQIHVEGMTKIKSNFIDSIEKENWDELPPFPTVLGFVKSISMALEVDPKLAVAVLKRDYPPKKLSIVPKPDVSRKFVWSPKLTFVLGVSLVLISLFGYLGFQYVRFTSPPSLTVESPKENQTVSGSSVVVFGTTDSDAKIVINNQPITVNDDGKFSYTIEVTKETKEVTIVASSRSGKVTIISRKIKVE
ncbi:MAG TPA: helix-turn-helix domain-containing protein [Patescibacteria group bacterium]|nr:helix-turn-helix domain-containing protein [Patescibacteria group bacterium]